MSQDDVYRFLESNTATYYSPYEIAEHLGIGYNRTSNALRKLSLWGEVSQTTRLHAHSNGMHKINVYAVLHNEYEDMGGRKDEV